MKAARGITVALLLALAPAACSSYRVVVQGVEVDRLIESRKERPIPLEGREQAVLHNDLGVLLEGEGDLEGALAQYRRARELDPALVTAYVNAGNVKVRLGRLEEARRFYREALEREPENPRALNNLAWVMVMEDRDLGEAVELLERALAADPEHRYRYLDSLGWALYRKGETDAAREVLREAIAETPEEEAYLLAEAHYHLGLILREAGEEAEAAFHFRESLRLRPDPERERELSDGE